MNGFLMMMTQNGKLLYISDNAAEYLGHSMASSLFFSFFLFIYFKKEKWLLLLTLCFLMALLYSSSISSMSLVSQVSKCVLVVVVGSLWKTVFDRNEVNNRQKWLERLVIGRHGGINDAKRVPIWVLSWVCIYNILFFKKIMRFFSFSYSFTMIMFFSFFLLLEFMCITFGVDDDDGESPFCLMAFLSAHEGIKSWRNRIS